MSSLKKGYVKPRQALADAARRFDWETVLTLLEIDGLSVNSWRLDGRSWYTPLHQAAYGGAPLAVVEKLIALGGWRTLLTAGGERAVDIARARGAAHLVEILEPVYWHQVEEDLLGRLQAGFWAVVNGRVGEIVAREGLRLPELSVLLELKQPRIWFPVPGMYGGFDYWLEMRGGEVRLVTDSWLRIVGGSGRRHVVTENGIELVAEGFV